MVVGFKVTLGGRGMGEEKEGGEGEWGRWEGVCSEGNGAEGKRNLREGRRELGTGWNGKQTGSKRKDNWEIRKME